MVAKIMELRTLLEELREEINSNEYKLLDDFLYEAIFIPNGVEAPPKDIINAPELQQVLLVNGKRRRPIPLLIRLWISVQVAGTIDWKNKAEERFDIIQRSIDTLNENFVSDKDFKNFVIYKG